MMKKILIAFFTLCTGLAIAQTRTIKIGFIDMDYILDKSPDYAEAKNQLEQRAAKWKQEMDVKKAEITRLKDGLQAERALLTRELIEEREEEIQFLEKDLSDYQQAKFGPTGELITQKAVLVKPIQDQVFTIVQDVAETRKYDFIFDKSSDLTMLFAAKKYDLSDLIVKRLSRAAKTEKMSSKERKELEEQEAQEELEADPDFAARKAAQDEKKSERERKMEERKAQKEAKIKENQEKREQQLREREAKRNGTTVPPATTATTPAATGTDGEDATEQGTGTTDSNQRTAAPETDKPATPTAADRAAAAKAERERKIEERKKVIDERNRKREADKEAARLKREEQMKNRQQGSTTPQTTTPTQPEGDDAVPADAE
jgi:Skp family chaperone for outer membrane proteins